MKKRIIWIVIIVLFAVAAVYKLTAGKQAAQVDIGTVVKGNLDKYVEETAVVKLSDETAIYASEGGKILEVAGDVGKQVKAGDILVRLEDRDILFQLKALKTQKESILAQYANAKEPVRDSEINKLNAQLVSAEVSYNEAKRNVENNKILYDQGAASLDTYQSSLASFATVEANLEAAKSNLDAAQKGISSNIEKQYIAQLDDIQTKMELLEKKKEDLIIKAPIDGVILSREIEKGNIVQPGNLLIEIGNQNGKYLESDILVEDISNIKQGSKVLISNEDLGIKDVNGTVRKIYPKAFSKLSDLGIEQKRVKVEIAFDNAIDNLKSGYDMNVKVITASRKDTLLVNEKAIFEYQGKDHVFVNENGVAKLRTVEKGIESGEQVEIISGLKEGEKVILSPDENLKDGLKIKS